MYIYNKLHIANWLSLKAFADFVGIHTSIINLWLQFSHDMTNSVVAQFAKSLPKKFIVIISVMQSTVDVVFITFIQIITIKWTALSALITFVIWLKKTMVSFKDWLEKFLKI